jgi:hypothetical protein
MFPPRPISVRWRQNLSDTKAVPARGFSANRDLDAPVGTVSHPLLPCSPPDVSPATTALPSSYINHPTAPRSSCCAGHRPRVSWNPTRED